MVLNEKALEARMKDAYKGGGYTVAVRGQMHIFQTNTWAVQINSENLPRNITGLLAVHMGFLPLRGTAYKITKTKQGPQVQSMIFEEALRSVEALEKDVVSFGVKRTGLTLDGARVWQHSIGTEVELINPDLEALLRKKENLTMAGDAFWAVGEISQVWIMRVRRDDAAEKLSCLSSIRWTA